MVSILASGLLGIMIICSIPADRCFHSGSHHILCCVFLRLVASFSGFFLFLIAPSVFSNVYLKYVSNLHLEEMMNIAFEQ
jgi:hypothetical protein